MKHPLLLPLTLGALLPTFAFASSGSATVILLRGNATLVGGKALQLKDEVAPGNTVKTEPRSFVKLLFKDNSQVNVGPDTTLKLEATAAGEPSLVNLVGGQIRAKVTKDLLQNDSHQSPEKLLIQTKTAAMGIRGTDFSVTYNQQNGNTALITFEGRVAMTKLDQGETPARALSDNRNVQAVGAGQYSGAQPDMAQASVPVKISPAQLETLRQNDTYSGLGEKSTAKSEALASPVPPGVDPKTFASGAERAITAGQETAKPDVKGPPPEGFFDAKTGSYAPRAGGFIDLATGRYVPPPPGSNFDPNTGVYTPPRAMGQFDPKSGMYVPPKGVELDAVKGFVPDSKSPGAAPSGDLSKLLNFAMRPDLAGQQSSFEKLFTPNAAGTAFVAPANFQPPPPPGTPPPPPPNSLPPPPKEPIDDPTCTYCQKDNQIQNPNTTNVNFSITVQ